VSTNFMILEATNQKLWMFQVFKRSLGRASMCWSQPTRVDHMRKKWRAGGKKIQKMGMGSDRARRRPAADRRPTVTRQKQVDTWPYQTPFPLFRIFLFLKLFSLEVWGMGQGFGEKHPHFLKLALTLGSIKCSIHHRDWRYYFFSNFIFSKFRIHLDLYINCWDFVS
jgi:hypothetical protein